MVPTRIGWASLAIAAAASVFAGVTLLNDNADRTGALQHRLEATPPATVGQVRELAGKVARIPTAVPTAAPPIVVTAAPGPVGRTGPAGPPGHDGQLRATVITIGPTPVPTVTRTVRPEPAAPPSREPTPTASSSPTPCSVAAFLAGVCVQR